MVGDRWIERVEDYVEKLGVDLSELSEPARYIAAYAIYYVFNSGGTTWPTYIDFILDPDFRKDKEAIGLAKKFLEEKGFLWHGILDEPEKIEEIVKKEAAYREAYKKYYENACTYYKMAWNDLKEASVYEFCKEKHEEIYSNIMKADKTCAMSQEAIRYLLNWYNKRMKVCAELRNKNRRS